MDNRRFDSLVKSLASGTSRRSVLKGILGLGGAALAGGASLGSDADAASRPTPTPKPVRCPGNQTWTGSECACPDGLSKCGPDCCNTTEYPSSQRSECCDNACCFGTCYEEERCCPTNVQQIDGRPYPPSHKICTMSDGPLCCPFFDDCCLLDGCCATICTGGSSGVDRCCPAENFCPNVNGLLNQCCTGGTVCCGANTDDSVCVDPSSGGCCSDSDCGDPCQVCDLESHTCGPRCDGETEVCCTEQAGAGRCQTGDCCPGAPCSESGQLCCVGDDNAATCVTTDECCTQGSDCDSGCLACVNGACIPQCTQDECCTAAIDRADWFCMTGNDCCIDVDCDDLPDACSTGQCGSDHQCVYTGCDAGQKCCGPDSDFCVPSDAICCTLPTDQGQITPAEVSLLCPECMTCNGQGYCVPDDLADGSACGEDGVCCGGACLAGANCCSGADCDANDTCCEDTHLCGPTCNGGVCCAGGFCDGDGNCCPAGNYACNDGVCCSEACNSNGDCPGSCEPICQDACGTIGDCACGDCPSGSYCTPDNTCCLGEPNSDQNCGTCGNVCYPNRSCQNGQCILDVCVEKGSTCVYDLDCCHGSCQNGYCACNMYPGSCRDNYDCCAPNYYCYNNQCTYQ